MMKDIYLRGDNKAMLQWVFVDKEYFYPKVVFTLDGKDLIATFYRSRGITSTKMPSKRRMRLKNFRHYTAAHVIRNHCGPHGWGRHFECGIKQVYRDLGLPIQRIRELRDL